MKMCDINDIAESSTGRISSSTVPAIYDSNGSRETIVALEISDISARKTTGLL